jgi:hypothetical protein
MAIRTQDTEVLQAIVTVITIDVIEREWKCLPAPLGESAFFAPRRLQSRGDEALAEAGAVVWPAGYEHGFERERREGSPHSGSSRPAPSAEVGCI